MIANYLRAFFVNGIERKAFLMSNMQKYLYFEAPSKKFLLLIKGKFLFFIILFILR